MTEPLHNLLEQHFDTAFAAPDGIKKLRELILTLAMQGKLVEQDPNDPPASELLKQIEAEKQRLHASSSSRKRGSSESKSLPPIKLEEAPYELPKGWEWVRLGDIVLSITGGGTPSKNNSAFWGGNIPWASVKDLNVDIYLDSTIDSITEKAVSSSSTNIIPKGSIIVCTRMGLGKIVINRIDTAINQDLKALKISSHIDQMFFFMRYKNYKIIGSGMTVHGIRQDELLNFIFPLPPLPEQHRIVAKIDQLMAKCDELETLRKEREEKRRAVHAAAIKQLLDTTSSFPRNRESSSSEELDLRPLSTREQACGGDGVSARGWNFIQQHFGELYTVKENVSELRKAILQLAVMGRLVPQDPNDPPASELLKQIEAEKQGLYASSPRKNRGSNGVKDLDSRFRGNDGIKTKSLPSIKLEEIPYQLPRGWEWVRLGDVSLSSDSGWSPQCLPERRVDGQWGILKVSAVSWGKFNPYENKALPSDKEPRSECEIKPGDFLLSRANTDELVARSVIVDAAPEKLMMSDKIVRFVLSRNINKYFINYVNGMNFSRNYYIANASGTSSSMKNVSRQVMAELPIPLPPLPEQHRIVAKVDQLMTLCDQLEQQIDAASTKQRELLDAVMSSVS